MKKKTVFSGLAAFISVFAIWLHLHVDRSEMLIPVFALGLFSLFRYSFFLKKEILIKKVSIVTGCLFSLFYILYDLKAFYGHVHYLSEILICFIGFSLLFSAVTECIYSFFVRIDVEAVEPEKIAKASKYKVFFLCFILLFLYFIFWLIMQFPGSLSSDSIDQMRQVCGLSPWSNHHPVIHTYMIKLLYELGMSLFNGNQNNSVALYCGFQAFLMAVCFAFVFETLYISGLKKKYLAIMLAVFILMPYHGAFSVTVWKDVLFGGWTAVISCTLWRIVLFSKARPGCTPIFECILLFTVGILMCLFRSNGLFAFALCFLVILPTFVKKLPAVPIISAAVLAIVLIIKGPIYSHLGIISSDTIEALSLPAQQIARTIKNGTQLSEEEYLLLSEIVDVSKIEAAYSPECSDNIKVLVREKNCQNVLREKASDYFRLWLKLGMRDPSSYIVAHIDLTSGYWYPSVTNWTITTALNESEDFELFKAPKMSEKVILWMQNAWLYVFSMPIFDLTLSIGAALWCIILLLGICIIRKSYYSLLAFVPALAIWATLIIATPIDAEFRYAYGMFTTLPLLCVIPFIPSEKKIGENDG